MRSVLYCATRSFVIAGSFTFRCGLEILPLCEVQLCLVGYPCKSLSMQNHSAKSFRDESSTSGRGYQSMMRFVDYARPTILCAENVAAMQHSRKRFENEVPIQIQGEAFERRGYAAFHELLCSSHFGLAQQRSRVWAVYYKKKLEPEPSGTYPSCNLIIVIIYIYV